MAEKTFWRIFALAHENNHSITTDIISTPAQFTHAPINQAQVTPTQVAAVVTPITLNGKMSSPLGDRYMVNGRRRLCVNG